MTGEQIIAQHFQGRALKGGLSKGRLAAAWELLTLQQSTSFLAVSSLHLQTQRGSYTSYNIYAVPLGCNKMVKRVGREIEGGTTTGTERTEDHTSTDPPAAFPERRRSGYCAMQSQSNPMHGEVVEQRVE
jgi:hypothetical protein